MATKDHFEMAQPHRFGSDRKGLYSNVVATIDRKIQRLASKTLYVGTVKKSLEMYDKINKNMRDTAAEGIFRLVDVDIETTASKLRVLETQQQLAIQSLAIANTASGTLARLFQ
ncbi:hypothetical protein HB780_18725 [Rhizobium lusitanum]|uniref:flagellin n=1 Tax=Rhizobium lusitanum TaxID=293958 RepID=UPI00161F6C2A|nr:flagellin [Rhizobium lusitanum]QND47707.1 hypothetical protein HB780_18725 [Rhizobium lusitanum]